MIRVPDRTATDRRRERHVHRAFWMDRFELSNRQFKAFVDAGGYRTRQYWKEPFVDDGRPVSWEDAMARFRDVTGRPGPSTWELGTFPQGQADFPVSGVSWYEAAAFAVLPGSHLPTAFQWRAADRLRRARAACSATSCCTATSARRARRPSARTAGIAPFGSYDMAGNVKEWCWNESRGGRMILGGGWNEPTYMYDGSRRAAAARAPADLWRPAGEEHRRRSRRRRWPIFRRMRATTRSRSRSTTRVFCRAQRLSLRSAAAQRARRAIGRRAGLAPRDRDA